MPILFHEHNSDVVMDDILIDIESVDNVPLSDDTELDDNKSLPFSFDIIDNYIMDSSGIDTDLEEFIISSVNLQCTCGTDKSSHHRSCPLNPRNKGKPAEKSDVEVITSEDAKPLVIGKTPSIGWMNSAALLMQDYTGECVRVGTDPLKTIKHPEIFPYVCYKIKGDGNCFYRAISKAVTGTENNHMPVRLTICAFMISNAFELSNLLLPDMSNVTHDSAVTTMKAHLLDKKLDKFGTWATENEIFVAATAFHLKIHISVLSSPKKRSWHIFEPLFHNSSCHVLSDFNIYLFHTNSRNHYDLVGFNLT